MKVFTLLVIYCFSYCYSQALTWEEYKNKFGKNYSVQENNRRLVYFNNQASRIENHKREFTAGRRPFNVDYNSLTDAGFGYEFSVCFEPVRWPTDYPKGTKIEVDTSNLPESFELESSKVDILDHTNNGNFTYMICNYGWAFAVAKAVEIFGINNSKKTSTISLSPQQLIDCWNGDNCKNGIPHKGFQYIVDNNQPLYPDESYVYTGVKKEFCTVDIKSYPSAGSLRGFSVLGDKFTEDQIKGVLVNNRAPIIFEINPFVEAFLNYKTGVFSGAGSSGSPHSHFMLIVGYGTETTIKGEKLDYWKVLNNWGPSWGENGYMKLQRNKDVMKNLVFPSKY